MGIWYLDSSRPLNFFFIPPDEALIRDVGETVKLTMTTVFPPSSNSRRVKAVNYPSVWAFALSGVGSPTGPVEADWERSPSGWIPRGYTPDNFDFITIGPSSSETEVIWDGYFRTLMYGHWEYMIPPPAPGVFDLNFELEVSPAEGANPLYLALNSVCYLVGRNAISTPDWDFVSIVQAAIVRAAAGMSLPKVKYLESFKPNVVPAGESFAITHRFINTGVPGQVALSLIANGRTETTQFYAASISEFRESLTMPWNDIMRTYFSKLSTDVPLAYKITKIAIEGNEYEPETGFPPFTMEEKYFPIAIPAAFPQAVLSALEAPDKAKPGASTNLNLQISNEGANGNVGVRVGDKEIMQSVPSGGNNMFKFTEEMPAVESLKITAIPIHLGRNKFVVEGTPSTVEITPLNALFHDDLGLKLFGGYAERNEFTGFVAGKNVTVKGLTITPGTGPLPFGYAGYMLTGELGEGESAEITYDELYYLRVESVRGIATARRGALVERDTKIYEYSTLPLPAMAVNSLKSLGTLLTKPASKLEVA